MRQGPFTCVDKRPREVVMMANGLNSRFESIDNPRVNLAFYLDLVRLRHLNFGKRGLECQSDTTVNAADLPVHIYETKV
jgi:hypothetical protein